MDSDNQSGKMISRNVVGVLLVVFVCSLFIGISSTNSDELAATTSMRDLGHVVAVETESNYVPLVPDPIYSSKRRVPSGPDPIHNRHVGETRRSPGRA